MGKKAANPREGDIKPEQVAAMMGGNKKEEGKKDEKKKRTDIEVPKKKIDFPEEPPKPDEEKFKADKAVIEKDLDKLNAEFKAAQEAINEKQSDKEEYNQQRQVLREDLDLAQKKVDDLFTEYNSIVAKIKEAKQAGRKANQDFKDMSKDVANLGEDGLEKEIKRLHYEMHVKSLSLKEEKEMVKRIGQLERERPKLAEKARKLEELEREKDDVAQQKKPLQDRADEVNALLKKAKEDKKEKGDLLRQLREDREAKTGNIREQIDAKNAIRAKVDEKRDEIRALRNAYKKIEDVHWDWKRACRKLKDNAWKAEEDLRWEIWRAEEKKQELEGAGEKPHFEETQLIEQTLTYCRGLIGDEKKEEKEEEKEVDLEAAGFPEGARICLPKKDRDANEGAFHQGKGKKMKQGNKSRKAETQAIKHAAGTFGLFKQLDLNAPLTLGDVPEIIKQLEEKMEHFQGKISEWEESRKKLADEVAATEKKAAEESAAAKEE